MTGMPVELLQLDNAPDVARINLRDPLLPGHYNKDHHAIQG